MTWVRASYEHNPMARRVFFLSGGDESSLFLLNLG